MKGKVQKMHRYLIDSLHIDSQLLADMHSRSMLSECRRKTIHHRLQNAPSVDVNTFFTNEVLFNWPPSVFQKQLQDFKDVLEEHSDAGNKAIANKFCKILRDCQPVTNSDDLYRDATDEN